MYLPSSSAEEAGAHRLVILYMETIGRVSIYPKVSHILLLESSLADLRRSFSYAINPSRRPMLHLTSMLSCPLTLVSFFPHLQRTSVSQEPKDV